MSQVERLAEKRDVSTHRSATQRARRNRHWSVGSALLGARSCCGRGVVRGAGAGQVVDAAALAQSLGVALVVLVL